MCHPKLRPKLDTEVGTEDARTPPAATQHGMTIVFTLDLSNPMNPRIVGLNIPVQPRHRRRRLDNDVE